MRKLVAILAVLVVVLAIPVVATGHHQPAFNQLVSRVTALETKVTSLLSRQSADDTKNAQQDARLDALENPPPPPPPPPPPGDEPSPITGQGYSKVLDEPFNSIDPSRWQLGMYWEDEQPSDVFTDTGGILHIQSRRSEGYPDRAISTMGYTWDTQPLLDWREGYFEARFRYTDGVGSMPAFWLMSTSSKNETNWPNPPPPCPPVPYNFCPSAELDIFEHFPINGSQRYEGTLHRNTAGCCGLPDQTRSVAPDVGFDMSQDWHVYSAKWTATEVCWYLNENLLGCQPVFDTFQQPMFLVLYMWTSVYGPSPDATTPDVLDMQVDWVRVWQQ